MFRHITVDLAQSAVQVGGWGGTQGFVQTFEFLAVDAVETGHGIRRVVVAEPPEPVGAFTRFEQRIRLRAVVVRQGADCGVIRLLGRHQPVPSPIFRGIAYPGAEIAIHPAAGNQMRQLRRPLREHFEVVAERGGADFRLIGQPGKQFGEEIKS